MDVVEQQQLPVVCMIQHQSAQQDRAVPASTDPATHCRCLKTAVRVTCVVCQRVCAPANAEATVYATQASRVPSASVQHSSDLAWSYSPS